MKKIRSGSRWPGYRLRRAKKRAGIKHMGRIRHVLTDHQALHLQLLENYKGRHWSPREAP